MRVSVVVPLYNKAPYVVRCLDSIASQTYADFEAIVVDDGSTDGGCELAAQYPDSRFRVIRQPNAGPGAARNRGLAGAKGEFVAFLDADDVWHPGYLDSAVSLFGGDARGAAAVTAGYTEYPSATSRRSMWQARGLREGLQRVSVQTSPVALVYMLAYMSPCTTVVRSSVIRRWGGFYVTNRSLYGEDAVLWLKVLLNETVYFHFNELADLHREASGLSVHGSRARPIEPFLLEPGDVRQCCPPELLPLLERFYAARACKTASVLGYWGQSRLARDLVRRYVTPGDWRLPFFGTALIGCTPLGGWLGGLLRTIPSVSTSRSQGWHEPR